MQKNPEIESIIENAIRLAKARQHEYVLTEHLLLALLRHAPFTAVLVKFGTDVDQLIRDVTHYLDNVPGIQKSDPNIQPRKTNALERLLNRSLTQVLFTGRRVLTTADLYMAIFAETNSHAH